MKRLVAQNANALRKKWCGREEMLESCPLARLKHVLAYFVGVLEPRVLMSSSSASWLGALSAVSNDDICESW